MLKCKFDLLCKVATSTLCVISVQGIFSPPAWSQQKPVGSDLPVNTLWKSVLVTSPTSSGSEDSYKPKVKQQLIDVGYTVEQAEATSSQMTSAVVMSSKGMTQNSIMNLTRFRDNIVCKITAEAPKFWGGGKADYKSTLIINYSDGKNFISLDSEKVERYPIHAQLTRNPNSELQNAGRDYGLSIYLTLEPREEFFPLPKGTQLPVTGKTLKVTHEVKTTPPVIYKATLKSGINAPIKIEAFRKNRLDKPFKVYEASNFEMVDGKSIPHRLSIKTTNEAGQQIWKSDYELLKVTTGQSVDLSVLNTKTILPIGTSIVDSRFGDDKTVSYRVRKGGFPGDATVLRLVEQREDGERQGRRQQQLGTARNFVLPIGALFMVGGLLWFRRSRRDAA